MKTTYSFMRHSFAAFLVTMGLLLSAATVKAQNGGEVAADVQTEIKNLNHIIEKSIQNKDYAAIVDLYADDATIMIPGGQKIQGRKAIAEYWYSMVSAKSIKSEIIELGGNAKVVYQIGTWSVTKIENGVEKTMSTDVVMVWKRESNFSYKIQLNSSSNPVAIHVKKSDVFEAEKP